MQLIYQKTANSPIIVCYYKQLGKKITCLVPLPSPHGPRRVLIIAWSAVHSLAEQGSRGTSRQRSSSLQNLVITHCTQSSQDPSCSSSSEPELPCESHKQA